MEVHEGPEASAFVQRRIGGDELVLTVTVSDRVLINPRDERSGDFSPASDRQVSLCVTPIKALRNIRL